MVCALQAQLLPDAYYPASQPGAILIGRVQGLDTGHDQDWGESVRMHCACHTFLCSCARMAPGQWYKELS